MIQLLSFNFSIKGIASSKVVRPPIALTLSALICFLYIIDEDTQV